MEEKETALSYTELEEKKMYWTKMLCDGKYRYVQNTTVINGEIYVADSMSSIFNKCIDSTEFLKTLQFIEMPANIAEVRLKKDGKKYYQHNIYK